MPPSQYTHFFLRHGKLLLPYRDHSEMPLAVLAELGLKTLNPPIDQEATLKLLAQRVASLPLTTCTMIYTSPSMRCKSTAQLIREYMHARYGGLAKIEVVSELREVKFDLESITAEAIINKVDINFLNTLVFRAQVTGRHAEHFEESFERVRRLFARLRERKAPIILITHDFFMRVIEIFVQNKGKSPSVVDEEILQSTRRNTYLTGFAVASDLSSLDPIF